MYRGFDKNLYAVVFDEEITRLYLSDLEYIARTYALVYQELGLVPAYNDKSDAERMIYDLVEMRRELRKGKQWQQADMVRNKLDEVGIALEDTPQGTVWKRKR